MVAHGGVLENWQHSTAEPPLPNTRWAARPNVPAIPVRDAQGTERLCGLPHPGIGACAGILENGCRQGMPVPLCLCAGESGEKTGHSLKSQTIKRHPTQLTQDSDHWRSYRPAQYAATPADLLAEEEASRGSSIYKLDAVESCWSNVRMEQLVLKTDR